MFRRVNFYIKNRPNGYWVFKNYFEQIQNQQEVGIQDGI